jgi:hypothetical protein
MTKAIASSSPEPVISCDFLPYPIRHWLNSNSHPADRPNYRQLLLRRSISWSFLFHYISQSGNVQAEIPAKCGLPNRVILLIIGLEQFNIQADFMCRESKKSSETITVSELLVEMRGIEPLTS